MQAQKQGPAKLIYLRVPKVWGTMLGMPSSGGVGSTPQLVSRWGVEEVMRSKGHSVRDIPNVLDYNGQRQLWRQDCAP